jgi:hypothetical protein
VRYFIREAKDILTNKVGLHRIFSKFLKKFLVCILVHPRSPYGNRETTYISIPQEGQCQAVNGRKNIAKSFNMLYRPLIWDKYGNLQGNFKDFFRKTEAGLRH